MLQRYRMTDQAALGFVVEQTAHIESEVYSIQYPDLTYETLIPVDETAWDWASSVVYFSTDRAGEAAWMNADATDMRYADVAQFKHEQGVHMAAIGYRWNRQEIEWAMKLGIPLSQEKARAAVRASEEMNEKVAFLGDVSRGLVGLFNNATVTRVDAPNDGTGVTRTWSTKTDVQILRDINDNLMAIWSGSNTVEMADTILLPNAAWSTLTTRLITNTPMTLLKWVQENNVYTAKTGRPLLIMGQIGLDTAGSGGVGRMIIYRRDPSVLKFHLPMRHQFFDARQIGPFVFDVPGAFRIGGTEIRRPSAVRYVDGIV